MAWLRAAPKIANTESEPRVKSIPKDDPRLILPRANDFIVMCWNEAGQYSSNGMGITPLTWVELKAYVDLVGFDLEGWQASLIIDMSRQYCNQYQKSSDRYEPPPYNAVFTDKSVRANSVNNVQKQFAEMRDRQKTKKR